jgi:hypothetical protein
VRRRHPKAQPRSLICLCDALPIAHDSKGQYENIPFRGAEPERGRTDSHCLDGGPFDCRRGFLKNLRRAFWGRAPLVPEYFHRINLAGRGGLPRPAGAILARLLTQPMTSTAGACAPSGVRNNSRSICDIRRHKDRIPVRACRNCGIRLDRYMPCGARGGMAWLETREMVDGIPIDRTPRVGCFGWMQATLEVA